MISRFKVAIITLSILFGSFIGWRLYVYATHVQGATLSLKNLKPSGVYKENFECTVCCDSGYKIGTISVAVDGKPVLLKNNGRIGKKSFEFPFHLDLSAYDNGVHTLDIEVIDSSYHRNKSALQTSFQSDREPFNAALLFPDHRVDQGRTVHLRINTNKENASGSVKFLSKVYDLFAEAPHSTIYECFIPIDCEEAPRENIFSVEIHDAAGNTEKLSGTIKVNSVEFKKGQGFSVSSAKLDDEKENSMSSKILDQALDQWLLQSPKEKLWSGNFIAPVVIKKIVTPFGEIRTTREKGRYQHKAVDLIDTPRAVVWATQSGKVIIKDRYVMSGNTVAIDHGHGIVSLYYHLNDFAEIEVGDFVKKGNPIGTLGMTGYASGYHLHWELRVNGVAIDPLQWLERNF